ncbi:MAG: AAA family ATPase, partial [Chitinophagaceae bacterium]|nr:AAA family ATPase [Chitinophagaceae bacterium]
KAGEIKLIDFIPASFYKADIRLNDKSGFRELSSGEKQRIFAVSSLIYHLSNISSVVNPSLNCYKSVNIIFDEIELYFHPDMQRTFISYLLESLKRTNLPNIYDLNFLFITHSPFILSDIPSDNILFLKKKGDKKEKEVSLKTFGANIHELLMDGFFMQQTLGGFALQQVQEILDFYERTTIATEQEELDKLKTEYTAKKSRFYFVRNSLGEAYISNMIRNHIREIEEKLDEKTFIEAQVQKLKAEVKRLEGQLNSNEAAIKK